MISSRLGGPARSTEPRRCFTGIGSRDRAQIDLIGMSDPTGLPIITSTHIRRISRVKRCTAQTTVRDWVIVLLQPDRRLGILTADELLIAASAPDRPVLVLLVPGATCRCWRSQVLPTGVAWGRARGRVAGVLGSLYPGWPVSVVGLAWACVLLAVAACACPGRAPRLPGRRARAVRSCGVRPRGAELCSATSARCCSMASTWAFRCCRGCSAAAAATQIDTATTKASTNPMVASTSFRS